MADLGWMSGKEGFSGVSLALCDGPVVVKYGFPVVCCPEGPGGPGHPPHQVTGGGTESEVRPPHPLNVFPVVFCPEGPGGPGHPPHQVTDGGTESEVKPPHPLSVCFGGQVSLCVSTESHVRRDPLVSYTDTLLLEG